MSNLNMQSENKVKARRGSKNNDTDVHNRDESPEQLQVVQNELCVLSPGDPRLMKCLKVLFLISAKKYRASGDIVNIKDALRYGQAARDTSPEGHPNLPSIHNVLGLCYMDRYQKTEDLNDLEAAIKCYQGAVNATPEGHSSLPRIHQSLGRSYVERYQRIGDLNDLEAAIKYVQATVNATPDGHPSLPSIHNVLGLCYMDRYQKMGDLNGLEAAIKYYQAAINAIPAGDSILPKIHEHLGISYGERYREMGDLNDLEAAFKYFQAAVNATPEGHPNLPNMHERLGRFYGMRYHRIADLKDLEAAFKYCQAAVNATPEGHPNLPAMHESLGKSYHDRYTTIGDLNDLEAAIKYYQAAVNATPEGHSNLPRMHESLGRSYIDRYERMGELKNLKTAIKYIRAAVNATPEGHYNLPSMHHILGSSYFFMHQRTGDLNDLETAIQYFQTAVNATPEGRSNLPRMHQSLGRSYGARYHRIGDLNDLEAAMKYFQAAVNATPEGHPHLPTIHESLGISSHSRYMRRGDLNDLEAGITYSQAAVNATPEGHSSLPRMHETLGGFYIDRYQRIRDPKDLNNALKYIQAAVNATPEGHYNLPSMYHVLGISYLYMYQQIRDLNDLEAAFKFCWLAIDKTPEAQPALPLYQSTLAKLHLQRYFSSAHEEDLNASYKLYMLALKSQTASPKKLWDISVDFTNKRKYFKSQQILNGYSAALNILPSLLWLGSSLSTRHDIYVTNNVPDVMSKAVSTALQVPDTKLAVTFLEQGLSTTHKQILQLRNEHIMLQDHFPILFQRLQQLSDELQGSANSQNPGVNYHIIAHKRQLVISTIRKNPGFESFLLPPNYSKLCSAAEYGPVVMLSCDQMQTDVIVIVSSSAPPVHLCLPDVSVSTIGAHMNNLKDALTQFAIHSRDGRSGKLYRTSNMLSIQLLESTISWLWTAVVKPIFDLLSKNGITDGRMWWCPSGPFTYLPLHAAAPLESNFIQSYTPTLEALIRVNEKHVTSLLAPDLLTIVGMAESSAAMGSWGALPSVEEEINTVTSIFRNQPQELKDSQATIKSVFEAMQSSSWFHLACHGQQDLSNPLKSGLILYDGKLELAQILDIKLSNPKFIYLSACETAMGDPKLMNEAMHLAGGFLAAGFQGAIGTLWSMADAHGPKVAEVVYKTILGENNIPDVRMAAHGLHLAIQKLRREGVPLHQWMPFIHLGI